MINNSLETVHRSRYRRAEAEFLRAFRNPATVHAMCEDYRAVRLDRPQHDEADLKAGRKIACPLLVLWGAKGNVGRLFDPMAVWRERASDVRGRAMPSGQTSSSMRRRNCSRSCAASCAHNGGLTLRAEGVGYANEAQAPPAQLPLHSDPGQCGKGAIIPGLFLQRLHGDI